MKEDEYRRFEEQLWCPANEEGDLDVWNSEPLDKYDARFSSRSTHDSLEQRPSSPPRRNSMLGQSDPPLKPLTPLRPSQSPLSTPSENISPTEATTNQGSTLPQNRRPDRQAIRTPSYLPLLDAAPRSPRTATNQPPASIDAQLSSSATLPTTTFSPLGSPQQRPLISTSAPRPDALHIRRSSSRSDISLRSSMRGPKSPKSPKHVLFSIDNVVMSPSTSPEIVRKQGQSSNREGKKRRHSTSSTLSKSQGVETTLAFRDGRSSHPQTPSIISYQDLEQTKPIGKSIGKDIGLLKKQDVVELDDALFAFDEDLTADQGSELEDGRRRKGKEKRKEVDKVCLECPFEHESLWC